ncbi:MAG: hypothetical protein ACI9SC_001119, partial [Gammaproteobacteria bacterium]
EPVEPETTEENTDGITKAVSEVLSSEMVATVLGATDAGKDVLEESEGNDILAATAVFGSLTGWKLTNGGRAGNIRIGQRDFDKLHQKQRKVKHWDESKQCFTGGEETRIASTSEWEIAVNKIRIH